MLEKTAVVVEGESERAMHCVEIGLITRVHMQHSGGSCKAKHADKLLELGPCRRRSWVRSPITRSRATAGKLEPLSQVSVSIWAFND